MSFALARETAVAVALALAAVLASCARSRGSPPPGASARRIISVSPATTEALYAIRAGDRAVGRSKFCDWPKEALALPIVGGFVNVDLEAVLQLQPDLVIGAPGPASGRLTEQLNGRGIASWFPSIESFAAIDTMITGLGERTLHEEDARAVTRRIDDAARAIEVALQREPSPRVLVVLEVAPVVAAGPHDFLDEMVHRARAVNVLTEGAPWQTVGFEAIMQLDPDIVVDASHVEGGSAWVMNATAQGWNEVRAVREGHVVALHDPSIIRPGPRVAQGLAALARALHPGVAVPAP
jgi:iron complex transport system substrate-binding protein